MYSWSKKNTETLPINFNASYRKEVELVPINMVYCLFQFRASNFFLGVHLYGWEIST